MLKWIFPIILEVVEKAEDVYQGCIFLGGPPVPPGIFLGGSTAISGFSSGGPP